MNIHIIQFGIGTVVLGAIPIVTFALGTWQARKVNSKKEHLAELHKRSETIIPLPESFVAFWALISL